jgi:hypothetical protein
MTDIDTMIHQARRSVRATLSSSAFGLQQF